MKIRIKETTTVRPAEKTPVQRLWLSNIDLLRPRYHLPTVYLYKPNAASSNFFDGEVLKGALSKALVSFYPAAGRLAKDENGRLEIDCNGEGVLFIEAETSSPVSVLGAFMPSVELQQLVPVVDYSAGISSYPLIVLQVTTFSCGSVTLGTAVHHALADGTAALHFINSWSNIVQGLPISSLPYHDRTILRGQIPPNPKFHHNEYDPPPTLKTPKSTEANSLASFHISADQLNTLKSKVNNSEIRYSTFSVLSAHIWRCVSKARSLPDDQATRLEISVDGRSRFQPPLRPGYFGNGIFMTAPTVLCGELVSEIFVHSVDRIHKATKLVNDEYMRSTLDYMEEMGDLTRPLRGPQTCASPNLLIVSWMRLPFYEADFGWGPPLILRPPMAFEGKGYVCTNPSQVGSYSLIICLEANAMESFKELFYDI